MFVSYDRPPPSPQAISHSLRQGRGVAPHKPDIMALCVAWYLKFPNPIYLKQRYIDPFKTRAENLGLPVRQRNDLPFKTLIN